MKSTFIATRLIICIVTWFDFCCVSDKCWFPHTVHETPKGPVSVSRGGTTQCQEVDFNLNH